MQAASDVKSSAVALLGRDAELAEIRRLLDEAAQGHGGALVIEGPAGIGKTSLLDAARQLAAEAGFQLAAARGGELEHEFAYGIARQLAVPILRRSGPERRAELLDGAASLAVSALGLAARESPTADDSTGDVESEESAAFHGLYWFFANLADVAPVVVSIDDAHWADVLSLRFLSYLIRRIDDLPVAVLIASRAGEAGDTQTILAALADDGLDRRTLRLAPMTAEEVGDLVRAAFERGVDSRFSEALHQTTGGNPFLVGELVRAVKDAGIEPRADQAGRLADLGPDRVTRTVTRRIERLGGDALALAQAVAIVGEQTDLGLAAALADLELVAAARFAAELEAIDILVSDEDGLRFRHPITRTAVYGSVSPARRGLQHGHAARMLVERGAPERAAAHLMRTPPGGDPRTVDTLRRAARDATAGGAPGTAAAYLQRALAEPPNAEDRPSILRELGSAEMLAGRPEAVEHLAQARDGSTDPIERARTARQLAHALGHELRLSEAAAVLEDAIAQLGGRDRELWLLLESDLHDAARRDLGRLELAERLGKIVPTLTGKSPAERIALAQWGSGAILGQARTAAEVARLGEGITATVLELDLELPGPGSLIHTLIAAERLDDAAAVIEQMFQRARSRGLVWLFARTLGLRAHLARARGSVADAEADGRMAVELCHGHEARPPAMILAGLIPALLDRSMVDDAQRALESGALEGTLPESMNYNLALFARARLRYEQGRIVEAIEDLHRLGARYERWGIGRPVPPWRSLLARAYWAHGDELEARTWAQRELAAAREWDTARSVGTARLTLGLVTHGARSIPDLEEAVAMLEHSPGRIELAHALVELGAALRRDNRRTAAREPLGRGMTLAAECGADALAERARAELRATGARPRRLMLSGLEALTPSERRVAEMAAAGQTNKQIAQALFLSTRTVETHVRHALQKLDLTGRAQLARRLEGSDDRPVTGPTGG